MGRIREIIDATFEVGVLTLAAEAELQQLSATAQSLDDLIALVILQQATLSGRIRRESDDQSSDQD